MKCPKCQVENPEIRKFCYECGAKLIQVCPACGCENQKVNKEKVGYFTYFPTL